MKSISRSIYLFTFIHLSIYLPLSLSIYLSIYLPFSKTWVEKLRRLSPRTLQVESRSISIYLSIYLIYGISADMNRYSCSFGGLVVRVCVPVRGCLLCRCVLCACDLLIVLHIYNDPRATGEYLFTYIQRPKATGADPISISHLYLYLSIYLSTFIYRISSDYELIFTD